MFLGAIQETEELMYRVAEQSDAKLEAQMACKLNPPFPDASQSCMVVYMLSTYSFLATHGKSCILQINTTKVPVRITSSDEHAVGLAIYVTISNTDE